MFSTTLAAAMTGLMAGALAPSWQSSYGAALAQAAEQHKPVAVFIARGGNGFESVVKEGSLGADAVGVLREKFVAVYVDTSTPAGSELASSFGIKEGLVISDKNGSVQALRHQGTLNQTELNGYLVRFSNVGPVATTVTNAPAASPVTTTVPGTVLYSPFAPTSSCPNGKCPYAR